MKSLRTPRHTVLIQDLRALRQLSGLTQTALAERLSRPQSYVAKVEGGERRMDVVEFVAWIEATGTQAEVTALMAKLLAIKAEQGAAAKPKKLTLPDQK